jgi:hypothetical protein
MQHAFSEHSIVGSCIKLAQTTFFDALPANAELMTPGRAGKVAGVEARRARRPPRRMDNRLDNWFYRQQVKPA